MSRIVKWLPVLTTIVFVACSSAQVSVFGGGGKAGGIGVDTSQRTYYSGIDEWHAGRIKRLTADDGWLTLVGLFPLPNGTHTFGSASDNELKFPAGSPAHGGALVVADTLVTLKPAPGVAMTLEDAPVGEMQIASDKNGAPSKIQMGSIQFYVIDRPGSLYLRVKDANSPVRKNFKSIDRYKVDPAWRFDATLERYNPPRLIKVPNVLGYEDNVQSPGAIVFQKDGKTYRLQALSQEGDEFEIIFGDQTSGHETYGGGRFVYVAVPGADNKTVIDFNKAYNPPCVFTEFATCPIPNRDNILPFEVEAGEKAYGEPVHHTHTTN